MNTNDPVFEALDRLARVADVHPAGDLMPEITRRSRANRRLRTALVGGGSVVVVAAALGLASVMSTGDAAGGPGYADVPSSAPTSAPDTSTTTEPAMGEYQRARADVDGDGALDIISIRVPAVDAGEGKDVSMVSEDVRLRVRFAAGATEDAGATEEIRFGEVLAPTVAGTPDLDGNGTAEVVLNFSGGDAAWLRTFTWHGGTVVQAEPATVSPRILIDDDGLYSAPEAVSSSLVDGQLISWVPTDDMSPPFEVRVWTWQLEEEQLVATEERKTHCMSPGQYPRPC